MKSRIKAVRLALNQSQRQFAESLGVSQVTVSSWERGSIARFVPSLICQKLHVNMEWLETGRGEMFNRPTPAQETFLETLVAIYDALPPERQKPFKQFARHVLADEMRNQSFETFARSLSDPDYSEVSFSPRD